MRQATGQNRLATASRSSQPTKVKLSAAELATLAVIAIAPWPLAMVQPGLEPWLFAGVALVVILSVVRLWLVGSSGTLCPALACIGAMILLGFIQVIPMSPSALKTLSPQTSALYERLIPVEQEEIAQGLDMSAPALTLSLNPDATKQTIIRLMALAMLFFVVRNGVASTDAAKRLCVVIICNGVLLAGFAVIQFITSGGHTLFWTFETPGNVFGPFVNRNHFAMYMNACVGLGLGLTISVALSKTTRGKSGSKHKQAKRSSIYDRPIILWLALCCGIMFASSLLSLSRGGVIALVIATGISSIMLLSRTRTIRRTALFVVPAIVAVLLVTMIGWEDVTSRMGTIWDAEELEEGRLAMWSRATRIVSLFPVFGTGLGTFESIEPMYMHGVEDAGSMYIHAHNEYLQALIEGGMIWLALTMALVGFVLRDAVAICKRNVRSVTAGLGIGLLFATVALATHAAMDFGLHIPAIAVFATVIIAYISRIGSDIRSRERKSPAPKSLGFGGKFVVSASLLFLCLVTFREATNSSNAAMAIGSARRLQSMGTMEASGRQIAILEVAAKESPDNANVHLELAQVHLDAVELLSGRVDRVEFQRSVSEHIVPAMYHAVLARNAAPTLAMPHVRIASHVGTFSRADTRQSYLDRVKYLCPVDPKLWYLCGVEELDYSPEEAWESWRRSLVLSATFLPEILERSTGSLSAESMLEKVIPDDALTIALAANQQELNQDVREMYLTRAIELYQEASKSYDAEGYFAMARVLYEVGSIDAAAHAYRKALARAPTQVQWRMELAALYYNEGKRNDARRELHFILGRIPSHRPANELMQHINQELALTPASLP